MTTIMILVLVSYLILTWISHYDNMMFGRIIPHWLCIFCLLEKLEEIKTQWIRKN